MITDVKNYPISQLFDIDTNVVYAIPPYQREYTWGKREWEALFDDITESNSAYFLGSIICINQTTDALAVQRLELVDGQQRMTTLSLFFAALYSVLKEYSDRDELDDDQKVELINLKRRLILKKGDGIRLTPQIQNYNQQDYKVVLAQNNIIPKVVTPPNAGNRKILRCYRFFQDQIKAHCQEPDPLSSVLELLSRFLSASLVKIEVASHSDAFILFESLNNRGIPLTPIDLIKNKLLAQLEVDQTTTLEHHFKSWRALLEYLGDDYAVQERFFRQYYNAFRRSLANIIQVPLATRTNLIQIYEKLIHENPAGFMEGIIDAGKVYAIILGRNSDEDLNTELDALGTPLKNLERIQGAPSYLMLLHLLSKREAYSLGTAHLVSIINLLASFFVRRNLTDTPPTRDLNRLFMGIIDKIVDAVNPDGPNLSAQDIVGVIRAELLAVSASESVFREKLDGNIYEDNSGVTRFVLCALAETGMTKETKVDLWKFDNKQFLWTIEHILPQGDNIPEAWIEMIAGGDAALAKEYQQTHVHRLGNLTISGFNSSLGNKSLGEKRDRQDKEGRHVGYKNGLRLNEDLASATIWGVPEIESRTRKLVDQTISLFQL